MSNIKYFTDEQHRILINIEQHYQVWAGAQTELRTLPYGLRWVERNGAEYLYERLDREGNAKSRGRRSSDTEAQYTAWIERKAALEERLSASAETLAQTSAIYRSLRLPTVSSEAAKILREADIRGMLGRCLMVVGTSAMAAYSIEAGGFIQDAPDQTDDFDMAWISPGPPAADDMVITMLKAVDRTYTMNTERNFQARNAKAHEIELLAAPSTIGGMNRTDQPKPIPLPEQEWLLRGTFLSHTVTGLDGSPARIAAPDPRWFALQKLWLSQQNKRNPLKRGKDFAQGNAVLNAVREAMPHYPLGQEFEIFIPDELVPFWVAWKERSSTSPDKVQW